VDAPTDEMLLRRYQAGDRTGFDVLVKRYAAELYRFTFRFTRSASIAEDIVQETFLKLHASKDSFDFSRRFKPWLFAIAANLSRDYIRKRDRRREFSIETELDSEHTGGKRLIQLLESQPEVWNERLKEEERSAIVSQVVQSLPEKLSEVLVLAYYHRFRYCDIAEILGAPMGTVKSRLHKALLKFTEGYALAVANLQSKDETD